MANNTVVVKHYDYDKKEEVVDAEVSLYYLAKSLNTEQLGRLLIDWINNMSINPYRSGEKVGKMVQENHRTLQGSIVNFMISTLYNIACDPRWTDARNETAVASCNFIKDAVDDGKIKYQPFI